MLRSKVITDIKGPVLKAVRSVKHVLLKMSNVVLLAVFITE